MSISTPLARSETPRFAFAGLVLGNVFLALGPVFVRMADVGPVASGFWRLIIAAPLLFLLARRGVAKLASSGRTIWLLLGVGGLCFAADLASWHAGIIHTKLANATLFGNVTSFLLPLWGAAVLRHRLTRLQILALVIAAAGAALLMGASYELSSRYLAGDLLCVMAGVFYLGYIVSLQHVRQTIDSWTVLALSTVVGAPFLLAAAIALGETVMPSNWWPVIILSLSSQVIGQGLMVYTMAYFSPIVIGVTLLVQPIIAATIGWFLFGELLTPADFIGAGAIGAAMILVRLPAGRSKA